MPIMNGIEFMYTYKGSAAIVIYTLYGKERLPHQPYAIIDKTSSIIELVETISKAYKYKVKDLNMQHILPCPHPCIGLDENKT